MPTTTKYWFTLHDMAERYSASTRTILRWHADKQIAQACKIGGRLMWRVSDVEAFDDSRLGVDAEPVRVTFNESCGPHNEGETAAFSIPDAAKLVGLQIASLVDAGDFGRMSSHLATIYAARKEAELRGREFFVNVLGHWLTAPRIYGYDHDQGGDDDGEPEGEPDTPQGGGQQITRQEVLDFLEREYGSFIDAGVRDFAPLLNQAD